jgi:hypothetical protein
LDKVKEKRNKGESRKENKGKETERQSEVIAA